MRAPALVRDQRGATIVEFALVAPVLLMLILGSADAAHTLYMRAALSGAVQKIARDSTLQENVSAASQTALDQKVDASVHALASNATLTFNRRYYRTFADAAAARAEEFTDSNHNGTCDGPSGLTPGEPYTDENNNGHWDRDGGNDGQGGAKDKTVYTVTITYPRMFPMLDFVAGPTTTVKAVTVLQNQPYDDQGTYAAATSRNCP